MLVDSGYTWYCVTSIMHQVLLKEGGLLFSAKLHAITANANADGGLLVLLAVQLSVTYAKVIFFLR